MGWLGKEDAGLVLNGAPLARVRPSSNLEVCWQGTVRDTFGLFSFMGCAGFA